MGFFNGSEGEIEGRITITPSRSGVTLAGHSQGWNQSGIK